MTIQISLLLVLALILPHHFASSCQVYPSEYAYYKDSVTRDERASANCRSYSSGLDTKNVARTEDYIHCDGKQLRLTDSDLGSEDYSSSDYYVWRVGATNRELLFIFPTRVNLTTITLQYYRDIVRGLPRLRFRAVPDDFDIWNAPIASYSSVEIASVPPGGEPGGRNNLAMITNDKFNTRRVLMLSLNSDFEFAVSEVKFFTCNGETTNSMATSTSDSTDLCTTFKNIQEDFVNSKIYVSASTYIYHSGNATTTMQGLVNFQQSGDNYTVPLAAGVTATVLILLVVIIILSVLLILWHKRRNTKLTINSNLYDEQEASYSMLIRGIKPQPLNASVDIYDQIQLSPSTGQSEHISKTECEKKYISLQDSHQTDKSCASETNYETETANPGYLTYAVVDKKKKIEVSKQSQENTSERIISHKNTDSLMISADPQDSDEAEKPNDQQSQRKENLEEMYAVVQKKPKKREEEETAPPIPTYTVEALYTVVQKKPK